MSVHLSLVTHLQPSAFHKQLTVHCEMYPTRQIGERYAQRLVFTHCNQCPKGERISQLRSVCRKMEKSHLCWNNHKRNVTCIYLLRGRDAFVVIPAGFMKSFKHVDISSLCHPGCKEIFDNFGMHTSLFALRKGTSSFFISSTEPAVLQGTHAS